MVRRLMAAVAGALVLLTGLWLALAPFALVQRTDATWSRPTVTTVATGCCLAVLGVVVLLSSVSGLVTEIHTRYPETARKPEAKPAGPAAPAGGEAQPTRQVPLESVVGPMIAAYQKDLAARGPETPLDAMLGKMFSELSAAGAGKNGTGAAAAAEQLAAARKAAPAAPAAPDTDVSGQQPTVFSPTMPRPAAAGAGSEPSDSHPVVTDRSENVVYIGRARVPGSIDRRERHAGPPPQVAEGE